MMFNIDLAKFTKDLTPWFWRTPRWKQWIGVSTWGVQVVNQNFNEFRTATRFNLGFTGQSIYLEKWLNLMFDPENETYQIINRQPLDVPFIWNKIEQVGNHIFNKSEASPDRMYIFNKSEVSEGFDFIVYVPAPTVLTDELIAAIRVEVDKYLIAGKTYDVTNDPDPWS